MAPILTFAIGDIHGCLDKLQSLLNACDNIAGTHSAQFICLGDYIDRGLDSAHVVDLLMRRQAADGNFICLRGNHEELLLRAAHKDRLDRDLMTWWGNGGEATLSSYDVDDPSDIPPDHLDWMRSQPLHTVDSLRLYVHAGIRPGTPFSKQSTEDVLWIREPFLSSQEDHGVFVVHGHTPTPARRPDLRSNRLNLDTGACFGGPLTAALFSADQVAPLFFIDDDGKNFKVSA